jgi:hypothetical protein
MGYDLSESDLVETTGSTDAAANAGSIQQPDMTSGIPAAEAGMQVPKPEFEYTALGKTVKEDIDTILKRASMGYDYAQKMQQFKTEQETFNQQRDGHLAQFGQWKQYHDYASENPEWAEFVRTQWEQKSSYGQSAAGQQTPAGISADPSAGQVNPEIAKFMEEYRNDKRLQREADEDRALNEQIQQIQKEFPDFDLSHTDPSTGASLEMRVLDHARIHGINSFKAAFKDLYMDQILERKITAAKEAAAKEITDRQKQGLISRSDTSSLTSFDSPIQKKSGSYLDGAMEMAKEMGIL